MQKVLAIILLYLEGDPSNTRGALEISISDKWFKGTEFSYNFSG